MTWRELAVCCAVSVCMAAVSVCRPPNTPATMDAPDGLPPATCQDACERLMLLGCSEAQPTAGGISCEAACEDVRAARFIPLELECISAALTVDAVRKCNVRCLP